MSYWHFFAFLTHLNFIDMIFASSVALSFRILCLLFFFSFYLLFIYVVLQASTDQSAVDTDLPYQVSSFAFSMIQIFGIIAVMSQVAWQVFIVFIPVIAVSIWYQVLFGPSWLYHHRLYTISSFTNSNSIL
jgi:hypothetical protein